MDRIPLKAQERIILGKKVKNLRKDGFLPGHVFGNRVETEHVTVGLKDFLSVFHQAGETGLIDLRIGEEKVRPVLIRNVQYDPIKGAPLHIDFYQVNLKEKVTAPVPIVLIGEESESVHMGETVVLQNLHTVDVEGLPTDLIEKIEVDISLLRDVDDSVTISQLNLDRSKLEILADPEEVVVKLAPAVTEEMKALLEEQEAEAAIAAETAEVAAEAPGEKEANEEVKEEAQEAAQEEKPEQEKP